MTKNYPPAPKPPLRIAVLECDTPLDSISERYGGGYGQVFKALLHASADKLGRSDVSSETGLDITKYDVVNQEVYPDLEAVDAVLISGSSAYRSSSSSHAWSISQSHG